MSSVLKNAVNILAAEFAGSALRWDLPSVQMYAAPAAPRSARQLDEIELAAHAEGFQRGHADGYAAGAREVREAAQRLQALLEHLAHPLQELDAQVEQALSLLCVAAARRLVNEELALDPQKVSAAVQEAVAALATAPRELRIHLHPADLQLLRDQLVLNTEASWKLVADAKLERGDCRVVGEGVQVDARLDTRQASIARAVLGDDE